MLAIVRNLHSGQEAFRVTIGPVDGPFRAS